MLAIALDPRSKNLNAVVEGGKKHVWSNLQSYTEKFHEALSTVLPTVTPTVTEESDLLSQLGGDRAPGKNLANKVVQEISVWQSEPSMEIRFKGSDGKWVYNSVFDYWSKVKYRFPLLAPIAQQVIFCYVL